MTLWLRILPYMAAIALVAGALFGAYHHGVAVTDETWQSQWNARDTRDAQAKADAERVSREVEQKLQHDAERVQADATQKLEQVRSDAVNANAAADRLRVQVQQLLASGSARSNTRISSGCAAGSDPGNLLAIVLDKSVTRNRELAAIADAAITNGRACEAQYSAMRSSERRTDEAQILPSSRPN